MDNIFVIGDIHGCFNELAMLIHKAMLYYGSNFKCNVISLGDMVDRGPYSNLVCNFFKNTEYKQNFPSALLGNHELKNIRITNGEIGMLRDSQVQTLKSYKIYSNNTKYIDHIEWFKTLPWFIETEVAYLCHGYVEPGVPFNEQKQRIVCGTMGGWNYLDKYYHSKYNKTWDELYNFNKPVIVGHTVVGNHPKIVNDKVYYIDTGCVVGGYLTGIMLPDFKIFQVPASQQYWQYGETYSENGMALPLIVALTS